MHKRVMHKKFRSLVVGKHLGLLLDQGVNDKMDTEDSNPIVEVCMGYMAAVGAALAEGVARSHTYVSL